MALFLFVAILLTATDKLWAGEICCEGQECFDDSPPFNGMPLPQCREDMNMIMKVYTRQNPTNGEIITRNSIPSCFKSNEMTMFIAHGWLQDENTYWMHDMKDAALAQGDCNVIIVGWKSGSQNPWYPQSASNTRTVGAEIALVSNNIINNGLSEKAFMYCVGHSLGAHVCGQAGLRAQFIRMTGLDPAGPLFDNRDWSVGLNPSSADLVDVIHTNGRTLTSPGLGTLKRLGHIDFYPNGGSKQPGCVDAFTGLPDFESLLTSGTNTEGFRPEEMVACSHQRAYNLFIESLQPSRFLSRYQCLLEDILPVSCSESSNAVQSMGFNAAAYSGRGIFYLQTNAAAPFSRD